jgi:hypothetical protein
MPYTFFSGGLTDLEIIKQKGANVSVLFTLYIRFHAAESFVRS